MASIRKAIGDLLVDNGLITPEELEQAQAERQKTGEPIGSVLSKLGLATESNLKNALELQYGVNYINLANREPEVDLIALLPEELIREQLVVPVDRQGDRLTIAMVDPSDNSALDQVKSQLAGKQLKAVVCLEEEFLKFVDKAFPRRSPKDELALETSVEETPAVDEETQAETPSSVAPVDDVVESDTVEMKARPVPQEEMQTKASVEPAVETASAEKSASGTSAEPPLDDAEPTPKTGAATGGQFNEVELAKRAQEEAIVLLANQILGSAIKRHCSNIHIQVGKRESLVHYRLNGRLFVDRKLPNTIVTALVARYKMMARLNLAVRDEPQDGHIKVKSASKEIVCLISVVPTELGENVVIWIV